MEPPSGTVLRVACSPGERRIALVSSGTLLDYTIHRPGRPDGLDDEHRGRVIARVPAMAGAFVALHDGSEGFLPDSALRPHDGDREHLPPHTGDMVYVRITRAASGGKGPRLASIDPPSGTEKEQTGKDAVPALLRRGPSPLERLAAAHPSAPVIVDDRAYHAMLHGTFGERAHFAPHAWDDALAEEIDALSSPLAALPGGALLRVQPTAALVALDVDAGGASAARQSKTQAQKQLNHAILPAIARQIRLRNLSGAIFLDLAGVPVRKRATFADPLKTALASDPLQPRLLGFTALGFAEISRPRQRPPLHEMLHGAHAAALNGLRDAWRWSLSHPGQRPGLRLPPPLYEALQSDSVALAEFRHTTGLDPALHADPLLIDSRSAVLL